MTDSVRRLGPSLATALLLALLLAALPGAASAADAPTACRVKNLATGASFGNLQRAVWAAQPGHRLRVRGTCIGTAVIRKDLRIEGVRRDGPAHARSGSRGPAMVIDPSVSDLTIASSLVVKGGVVIGDVAKWRRAGVTVPKSPPSPDYVGAPRLRPLCDQQADDHLAARVANTATREHVVFFGTCVAPLRIATEMKVIGSRVGGSSIRCDEDGCVTTRPTDSGPPRVWARSPGPAITVDPSVDRLMLAAFRIGDGFRIGPTAS